MGVITVTSASKKSWHLSPASLPPGNYSPTDWIIRVIFLQSALDSALKSRAALLLLPGIRWVRSPFDPIHINDHFTLFSALRYLFFFFCFFPPKVTFVINWRLKADSFVPSFECACFLFQMLGEVFSPHTSSPRAKSGTIIARLEFLGEWVSKHTDKSLGLSKQDWSRIRLVNLIWQWKTISRHQHYRKRPKNLFSFWILAMSSSSRVMMRRWSRQWAEYNTSALTHQCPSAHAATCF